MEKIGYSCLLACLLLTGCRQQMAKQPAYRPLQPSAFFEDGRASRPLVEGTVARGQLKADVHFHYGRRAGARDLDPVAAVVAGVGSKFLLMAVSAPAFAHPYADTFPNPVT